MGNNYNQHNANGKQHGTWKYISGVTGKFNTIVNYNNGVLHGEFNYLTNNHYKPSINGSFNMGKPVNPFKHLYMSGKVETLINYNFIDNEFIAFGIAKSFHENGTLKKLEYYIS